MRRLMKTRYLREPGILVMLLVLVICFGVGQATGQTEARPAGKASGVKPAAPNKGTTLRSFFKGTVVQLIDAGRYVYLQIDTAKEMVWVAVPVFAGKPGDEVLVPPGVPVANFHSKRLDRQFKMIYFVGSVRRVTDGAAE
jgi:predicted secreted protein